MIPYLKGLLTCILSPEFEVADILLNKMTPCQNFEKQKFSDLILARLSPINLSAIILITKNTIYAAFVPSKLE